MGQPDGSRQTAPLFAITALVPYVGDAYRIEEARQNVLARRAELERSSKHDV